MAKVIGNGLTATFTPTDAGTPFSLAVTSISLDGGERPQIDITASNDASRTALPGLRAVPTGSITGVLQTDDLTSVGGELSGCDVRLGLLVQGKADDCTTDYNFVSSYVYITGYTADASMDEAATITVNFMIAPDQTAPEPETP
jgi:hypothetical protein